MKSILATISILFLGFKSYGIPNGLALIASKNDNGTSGFAHGVVVDGKLITSAHVFTKTKPTHIYVVQNNKLINIAPLSSVKVHPRFLSPETNFHNLNHSFHNPNQLELFKLIGALPYDFAFIEVDKSLKSDFILPTSKTFKAHLDFQEELRAKDAIEMVLRFKASHFTDGEPLDGRELNDEHIVTNPTTLGTLAANILFDSLSQTLKIEPSHDANIFIYPENLLKQGHSGSPLTLRTRQGKHLILALSSAITTLNLAGGSHAQTFFTPQMEISRFIEANSKALNGSCSNFLN